MDINAAKRKIRDLQAYETHDGKVRIFPTGAVRGGYWGSKRDAFVFGVKVLLACAPVGRKDLLARLTETKR